ncbi:MAG TPA: cytochrome c oxidase subunit 3 [Xanthomonadales bacterium]|nr:cytochrome c oxidase subunit 3 [Xanthomonadales bacterium]
MNIFRRLAAKPWEHSGDMEGMHGGNVVGRPASKTGLYMFLAVITSMFLLFSISHQMRATYPDWKSVAEPGILWINTVILVLASVAMQYARNATRREAHKAVRNGLLAASVLTLMFVSGQLLAWREMLDAGYYARSNPANAFFYLFTAIHAIHLLGGMWFLLGALKRSVSKPDDEALPMRVSLVTTYWHFLLLVWALLFYLLLTS